MINKEKIVKFFEENGIRHGKNMTPLKNLYLIFELISDEETYNEFIEGDAGKVRNPYKTVYPIKPGKGLLHNVSERAKGTMYINKINNQAKLEYCMSVIMSAAIFHKMGYIFSEEEVARVEKCYDILYQDENNKNKKMHRLTESVKEIAGCEPEANFPFHFVGEEIKKIVTGQNPSKEESEEYRKKLLEALNTLNDKEATKDLIYDIVNNNYTDETLAMNDIVNLICAGKINFNENININGSKVLYVAQLADKGIESSESVQSMEEYKYDYMQDEMSEEKLNQYNEVIDEILEKSYKESESGKDLALCLYNNLNEALLYNTTAFSWGQDNENIQTIINNEKLDDINYDKNVVTCHTWSNAMLDLLSRAGYDAYKVGEEGHQFVLYFDEDRNACVADGTNPPGDDVPNWFRAADISRNKLGLAPSNLFQILGNDEYLRPNNLHYYNNELVRSSELEEAQRKKSATKEFNIKEFKKEDGTYDYTEMLKAIDENPAFTKNLVDAIKYGKTGKSTIGVLNEIIKSLTKGHEDDDLLALNCISNIVFAIKSEEYSFAKNIAEAIGIKPAYSIGASHDLYKKVGDRTKFVPLIYIKEKDGVTYYIWDESGEFVEVDKQDLLDKINSGEYHSSSNNGSKSPIESRNVIAGIKTPKKSVEDEEEAIFGKKKSEDGICWQSIE